MLEDAASMNMNSSSLWSSMASWFTPTVLFLLLNLMIGTIALSSTLSFHKQKNPKKNQEPHHHHHLDKSPSVLHRFRSINFSSFRFHETSIFKASPDSADSHHPQTFEESQFQDTHQETPVLGSPATHYIFRQEYHQEESLTHYTSRQEEEEERESMDEVYSRLNRRPESQSQPEVKTSPEEEEVPEKKKKKKSASMKSRVNPFEEGENLERRRPATVKERGAAVDLEVDARADDFINRFKQQLKMQRLDSILRYKEMIGRGAEK